MYYEIRFEPKEIKWGVREVEKRLHKVLTEEFGELSAEGVEILNVD